MDNISGPATSQHLASVTHTAHETWLHFFIEHQQEIEAWFIQQFNLYPAPLYASVDLRFAGYKLAPVDTNLFSAGFNNISHQDYSLAINVIKKALIDRKLPLNWLLVPENHTRNQAYWENVHVFQHLFSEAGCHVKIGSLLPELHAKKTLNFPFGTLELHPLMRKNDDVGVEGFHPEAILLNNDFADGVPPLLQNIRQPIYPSPQAGWHYRRKSHHAHFYQQVVTEFARFIQMDPWLINTDEVLVDPVDWDSQDTWSNLARQAQLLFTQIDSQYRQRDIVEPSFVMLKANAGTYGQAVISLSSSDMLLNFTRKQKQEMRFTKGKQQVNAVLLQEGVYTAEYFSSERIAAEPVIYLINGQAIGGFYRTHPKQAAHDNLNKPGMTFIPFSVRELLNSKESTELTRCYAYTVVARLAALAAAKELSAMLIL